MKRRFVCLSRKTSNSPTSKPRISAQAIMFFRSASENSSYLATEDRVWAGAASNRLSRPLFFTNYEGDFSSNNANTVIHNFFVGNQVINQSLIDASAFTFLN